MMIRTNHRRYLTRPALLPLLLLLAGQLLATSPQASSSSYLDDYFSTAKYALNKLQQSLTTNLPAGGSSSANFVAIDKQDTTSSSATSSATTTTTSATTTTATATAQDQTTNSDTTPEIALVETTQNSLEPDKNDFVKVGDNTNNISANKQLDEQKATISTNSIIRSEQQEPNWSATDEPTTAVTTVSQQVTAADEQLTTDKSTTNTNTKSSEDEIAVINRARDDDSDGGGPTATVVVEESPSSNSIPQVPSGGGSKTTTSSGSSSSNNDDIIKEIEMNAVVAVDQSIGFGNDLNFFNTDKEPCYDEYGNPRFCEPEFENIAFERQVEVSSECGQPASRFCTTLQAPSGQVDSHSVRNCHICDSQHPKKRHPASYLTDLNSSQNPTCWVSAPIQASSYSSQLANDSSSSSSSIYHLNGEQLSTTTTASQIKGDNVTLVVNFDKRYEILYVNMQFCSLKPDSLVIEKSNDFGHSWQPYQYYSSYCARLYNRQQQQQQQLLSPTGSSSSSINSNSKSLSSSSSSTTTTTIQQANNYEASCVNVSYSGSSATRVAFTTLDGSRVGANGMDKSPALQDWLSATNIRITLDRHQAAWIQSNLAPHSRQHSSSSSSSSAPLNPMNTTQQPQKSSSSSSSSTTTIAANSTTNRDTIMAATAAAAAAAANEKESIQQLTNPSSDTFNYAISDLTIGGRCKCNGHASRCIHGKEGRLQCDCRHNTAGRDCEKCAPLHADRPWARATPTESNICQACNCNGHSRKCRFDPELYRLSGRRSGGVCLLCKDNTDGRYCHYCKEGFTRDHSKPMSDKEACKPCDCHPIGSLGRVCNQTNGQCPCKEGVTGLLCNRCAPGYQQSSSQSEPCIKIPPPETNNEINSYDPSVTSSSSSSSSGVVDEQPTIDQVTTADQGDTPTIMTTQDQQQQLEQQQQHQTSAVLPRQQQQQLPVMTSRAPSGGDRWIPDLQSEDIPSRYWPVSPAGDQLDEGSPLDEERSPIIGGGDGGAGYGRSMQALNQYWLTGRKHSLSKQQQQQAYYGAGRGPYGRRQPMADSLAESDPMSDESDADTPIETPINNRRVSDNMDNMMYDRYAPRDYLASRQRPPQGRYRHHYQQQQQQQHYSSSRPPMHPMANLDPTDADDLDESGGNVMGQYPHSQPNHIYSDESNQIIASRDNRRNHNHHPHPHNQRINPMNQQQQQQSSRRPLSPSPTSPSASSSAPSSSQSVTPPTINTNNNNVHPNVISVMSNQCGECQSNMRRLKSAKFCELEFAIRCTILNKFVAEDWTKLDIEIQDIFKSPMGAISPVEYSTRVHHLTSTSSPPPLQQQTNFVESQLDMMQQDSPVAQDNAVAAAAISVSLGSQVATSSNNSSKTSADNDIVPQHRLKVGTVQTIWVPTEDLACKCLRLKRGSNYLLMGTIDAKENSVNSLQLDRHGVALEWRPSLQSKMLKLQRKYARGSLCV